MVLRQPVYDIRGYPVFEEGEALTIDKLPLLARTGAAEIVIDDARVDDVPVGSMFPAYLEAKAVQALHLLFAAAVPGSPFAPAQLVAVRAAVNALAQRLFPEPVGDPDVTGCIVLEGYDYAHPVKTAVLSMLIGRMLGFEKEELSRLGMAAVLQNSGYLLLPPGLLETPRKLREEDWEEVHGHPLLGRELLAESCLDTNVLDAIEQHHERWSGRGYPRGLQGEDICIFARVIAVADTLHALLSRRPHRPPFLRHEALEFISAYSADLFDPRIASLVARRIPVFPAGLGVRLNSGQVGIVSNPNVGHLARPVVRICVDNGRPVNEPYDLDLSHVDHMRTLVTEVLL